MKLGVSYPVVLTVPASFQKTSLARKRPLLPTAAAPPRFANSQPGPKLRALEGRQTAPSQARGVSMRVEKEQICSHRTRLDGRKRELLQTHSMGTKFPLNAENDSRRRSGKAMEVLAMAEADPLWQAGHSAFLG